MLDIVRRARGLLFAPHETWAEIAAEGDALRPLLTRYVPALALPPLLLVLALRLLPGELEPQMRTTRFVQFGADGSPIGVGTHVSVSLGDGLVSLVLLLVLAVAIPSMYGLILANASRFGANPDRSAAVKLLAYAATPAVLGSWLFFVPFVGILVGITGIVLTVMLFRSGAPRLLPPTPGQESRFGRAIAARAIMLCLAFPLALVGVGFVLLQRASPPPEVQHIIPISPGAGPLRVQPGFGSNAGSCATPAFPDRRC